LSQLGALGVLNLEGVQTRYEDPNQVLDRIAAVGKDEFVPLMQEIYSQPVQEALIRKRIQDFKDLVPSTLPFVEGKMDGHKERKNYSIVGPGVAEDSKQFVKIAMPHSFNLGAVSAMPKNGSGLHSHTTAEVFIIYSGKWKFYWGAEGKDETILSTGDIISMPTNMFRAFENAGDEEGLIFVVLGGDDPGIITWVPSVLEKAKKTGMALLNDNSLIDLSLNEIPK
jgi:quercetin dioxygenase-like cupin family protein